MEDTAIPWTKAQMFEAMKTMQASLAEIGNLTDLMVRSAVTKHVDPITLSYLNSVQTVLVECDLAAKRALS